MRLYPHQEEVLNATRGMSHVAYYLDMGLGKTFVGSEKMMEIGNRVNLLICQKTGLSTSISIIAGKYSSLTTLSQRARS